MIKNILRIIDDFYIKLIISTSGRLYCFLFNFRALMLDRDVRFKHLKHKNYLAKDQLGQRYFKTEKSGFSFYNKGIKSRALEIGNDYHLDKIEFFSNDLIIDCGKKQESTFLSVTNFLLKNNFELVEVNLIRITALFKNKKTNI